MQLLPAFNVFPCSALAICIGGNCKRSIKGFSSLSEIT